MVGSVRTDRARQSVCVCLSVCVLKACLIDPNRRRQFLVAVRACVRVRVRESPDRPFRWARSHVRISAFARRLVLFTATAIKNARNAAAMPCVPVRTLQSSASSSASTQNGQAHVTHAEMKRVTENSLCVCVCSRRLGRRHAECANVRTGLLLVCDVLFGINVVLIITK